jgi:short-subunit dehydrogenase
MTHSTDEAIDPKAAIVTGASEGIGRHFCVQLAQRGYVVTAVARNEARLQTLLNEMRDVSATRAASHDIVVADLSTEPGIETACTALRRRRYHVLINNAGVGVHGDFVDNSLADQRAMMHLNMDALVALAHTFLSRATRGDVLMNVSSVLGYIPYPELAVYAATKAFVTSLTASLWVQQQPRGVTVLALHPGSTDTLFAARSGRPQGFSQPRSMVQTAEQVVKVGIDAIERRDAPIVVSGRHNKLLVALAHWLPTRLVVQLANRRTDQTDAHPPR